MERVGQIIKELKKIRTETTTKVSDELIWDSAIRIYNSENMNKNNQKNKNSETREMKKATEKQKDFMKKLGIKFDEDITSKEAGILIDEKTKKK
ncbi:MAG: hypothetical protein ACOCT9_02350 [archaeon]